MNNLFNPSDAAGILARLEQLNPNAQALWGKMTVNQMLAHCKASLDTAMGLTVSKRVGFILRLLGKLMKPSFFGAKPFPKNSATDPSYIIAGQPDFDTSKTLLIKQVKLFSEGGPSKCTTNIHAFFGQLTPEEWATMQWKHFDHHLRQFGA